MHTDSTDMLHSGALDNLDNYRIFRRRYPRRESLPTKSISDWHLQETQLPRKPRNAWICLVGVCEGILIRTPPVTSVISPRKVCTSNCTYVLGPSTRVLEHPVRGLEKLFADGFPSDWESRVEQALSGFPRHSGTLHDEPHTQDSFQEKAASDAMKTSSMHGAISSCASSGHIDLSYNGDVDDSINALLSLTPPKSNHAASTSDAHPHSKCALPLVSTERGALPHSNIPQTTGRLHSNDRLASSCTSGTSPMTHGTVKTPLVSNHPSSEQRNLPSTGHLRKRPVIRIPPREKLPILDKVGRFGIQTPSSVELSSGASASFTSTKNPFPKSTLSTEDISVPSEVLNINHTSPTTAVNKNRKRKLRLVMPKRFKMLCRRKY